jgi:hypothetical protein
MAEWLRRQTRTLCDLLGSPRVGSNPALDAAFAFPCKVQQWCGSSWAFASHRLQQVSSSRGVHVLPQLSPTEGALVPSCQAHFGGVARGLTLLWRSLFCFVPLWVGGSTLMTLPLVMPSPGQARVCPRYVKSKSRSDLPGSNQGPQDDNECAAITVSRSSN